MTVSIEDRKIFADLAIAIADALEDPTCPESLRDPLTEATSELTNLLLLSASHSAILRALASLTQSGDGKARPEAETLNAGHLSAKANA